MRNRRWFPDPWPYSQRFLSDIRWSNFGTGSPPTVTHAGTPAILALTVSRGGTPTDPPLTHGDTPGHG